MKFERLAEAATANKKGSVNLAKLFARATTVSKDIAVKTLRSRTELLETRKKTYNAIRQNNKEQEGNNNILGTLLGTLGIGKLAQGLRGARKAPMVSMRPGRVPTVPGRVPRIGRLGGPLNVAFSGLDFMQRRGAGQTNLQAGLGAAGGLAGGLAGMKAGAALGTLVAPGLGTLIGGALGGALGGIIGGNVADRATGVNVGGEAEIDRRLQEEERRTALLVTKTQFGGALDTFDTVLDKLAQFRGGICECAALGRRPEEKEIEYPKDRLREAFGLGFREGMSKGRSEGKVTGFATGISVAVVAGMLYLRFGKGAGSKLFQVGKVSDLVKTKPAPSATPVIPKVKPAPTPPAAALRIQERINQAVNQSRARVYQSTKNIKKLQGEETAFKIARITEQFKGRSNAEFSKWLKKNGDRILKGENGNEALKAIFNELRRRGMEVPPKLERFVLKKAGAGDTKPVAPVKGNLQSSVRNTSGSGGGGETVLIASEPDTIIKPVAVGGGGGGIVMGGGGATPYQAATKYAQIMSQFTA